MLVKKLNSSPSMMSYPVLFVASQNTTFLSLVEMCCILTLDQTVNQRCTCVNKWKKKWKQVGVMKEYRQVPVGDRKARVKASLQTEGCGPEQPQSRCGRSTAMVKRSWVNIVVCPCLHSSLTYYRNIENKVCGYIFL